MDYNHYPIQRGYAPYHGSDDNSHKSHRPTCPAAFCKWRPRKDNLAYQLIRESNIHGVKYLGQPNRHIVERLFWLIAILASGSYAGILAYQLILKLQNSIFISFDPAQTSMGQIPFPAVTVCSVNLIRKSNFERALRMASNASGTETEESQFIGYHHIRRLDHMCETTKSLTTKFNYSLNETTVNFRGRGFKANREFDIGDLNIDSADALNPNTSIGLLMQSAQRCEELILLCSWEGRTMNCSEIFRNIVITEGRCCTFNLMPLKVLLDIDDNDPRISIPERQLPNETLEAWKKYEDTLGFKNPDSDVYDDPEFPKHQTMAGQEAGLSFLLNPELSEYFCSGHDSTGYRIFPNSPIDWPHPYEFGIATSTNSEMFISLQAEVTTADNDLRSISIDRRKCYFLGEHKLKFFRFYTLTNCVDECLSDKIKKICSCIRYNAPEKFSVTSTYCDGKTFQCSKEVEDKFDTEGTAQTCPHCLPSCNEVIYRTQTSSLPIEDNTNIWMQNETLAPWAGKGASIVHVFFGTDNTNSRIRRRRFGYNELIANIGAIVGLFLGLSFMSLLEPLYFTIRLCCESRRSAELEKKSGNNTPGDSALVTARTGKRKYSDDFRGRDCDRDRYYYQIRGYMGQQNKKHIPVLHFDD